MQISILAAVISAFVAGMALVFALGRIMWFTRGEGIAVQQMLQQFVQQTVTSLQIDMRRMADRLDKVLDSRTEDN